MELYNLSKGQELGAIQVADNFLTRFKGLLGQRAQNYQGALWLRPCNSIHTLGMRDAIDVLFLDKQMQVLKAVYTVQPGKLWISCLSAHSVLESFSGAWGEGKVEVGDQLKVDV